MKKNKHVDLLEYKKNVFSQNGEDGIIAKVFEIIGTTNKLCCEFGAWDGVHFSNTHKLIKREGWSGVQIEADPVKFNDLKKTYSKNKRVVCVNSMVDDSKNSLASIFKKNKLPAKFDLLSIDIDGLDYYILKKLALKPRVVCVEVNAGHDPADKKLLPRNKAKDNIGQSLGAFDKVAKDLGYRLVAYNGNAFFVRNDVGSEDILPTLSPSEAYSRFIRKLSKSEKAWLYRVNRAWAPPFHKYQNKRLSAKNLRLLPSDAYSAYQEHRKYLKSLQK